jgi:hypothetical protein
LVAARHAGDDVQTQNLYFSDIYRRSSSADLRHLAMRYATLALQMEKAAEREQFFKIREALLQLANNEDWLNGRVNSRFSQLIAISPRQERLYVASTTASANIS